MTWISRAKQSQSQKSIYHMILVLDVKSTAQEIAGCTERLSNSEDYNRECPKSDWEFCNSVTAILWLETTDTFQNGELYGV